MNKTDLYAPRSHTAAPTTGGLDSSEQEISRRRLEQSRKTILTGWIISMIGIVLYCFVMSSGDQTADLSTALAARGAIGWAAVTIIFIGLGLWFAGYVGFMKAADYLADDVDKP